MWTQEKFEGTKGIISGCRLKDAMAKFWREKMTINLNYGRQNTIQKTQDWATQAPLKWTKAVCVKKI
jgi:hypothetical protein